MPETTITHIRYRTVYDSRGVETLEVDVITEKGFGRVAAPFGAPGSRGEFEASAYAPGGLRESMAILEKTLIPSIIESQGMKKSSGETACALQGRPG